MMAVPRLQEWSCVDFLWIYLLVIWIVSFMQCKFVFFFFFWKMKILEPFEVCGDKGDVTEKQSFS